jgi:hypothetical protein
MLRHVAVADCSSFVVIDTHLTYFDLGKTKFVFTVALLLPFWLILTIHSCDKKSIQTYRE